MGNVTTTDIVAIDNSSTVTSINNNVHTLRDEFDKVVYKDGREEMTDNLDMNSQRIINLPDAISPTEPVTLNQIDEALLGATGGLAAEIVVRAAADAALSSEITNLKTDTNLLEVGLLNDQPVLQTKLTALDTATPHPGGVIKLFGPSLTLGGGVVVGDETVVDFQRVKSFLSPGAGGVAFSFGATGTNTVSNAGLVGGTLLDLYGSGATGVYVNNAANFRMSDMGFDLRDANQIGIHLKSSDFPARPLGPYYGSMSDVRVTGNSTPTANQTAVRIEGQGTQGSITPNRWNNIHFRHLAAVDYGLDIRGCDGFTIESVNLEGCYNRAVRFGFGNRQHTGSVTALNGISSASFFDTSIIPLYSTHDYVGTILITSGLNNGLSGRGYFDASGLIVVQDAFPYQFTLGDTYKFTEPKARGCNIKTMTYEGSSYGETCVEFLAGALDNKVHLDYATMPTGNLFTREIEDAGNTISKKDLVYTFEKAISATNGSEWMHINHISSTAGGIVLPEACWIDAIYVTAEVKGVGTPGIIEVEPYINGVAQPIKPILTPDSPVYARRVRKSLAASAVNSPGQHLKILLNKTGMAGGVDQIRVQVHLGT